MSKLERAIAALKALPTDRQEELAEYVIEMAEEPALYRLTGEQLAEVRLALKELDEGKFATKEEMDALWRRAGLTS